MVTRFGAYEILHALKAGGMGAVLLARRKGPGAFEQLVAIKTIRAEYAGAAAVRAMFLDEAAILARINHPGIATVHDFGEQNGTLYMAMEYVAGVSFRTLIDLRLPPAVAARAIVEACRGVHAAHQMRDMGGNVMGVVHRDISPDNLMLGFDGHVKVIDFGIALVKNRQAPVTEFGTVKGKPPYMSPEQVKNETMDHRSDVFSLAVVLHELLTGQPLFDGDSIYAVARAVEHRDLKPPSQHAGMALPLGLDAAVMNALERSLARRTPTAAAFAEQLEQVINTAGDETLEAWSERELAAPRDTHRKWLASVVAGHDLLPQRIGRATGSVTQLGPLDQGSTRPLVSSPAQPEHESPPEPGASTHLAASIDDDLSIPPRRSMALPILLVLLVLFAVGGGVMWLRGRNEAPAPDARLSDVASVDIMGDPPLDAAEAAVLDAPLADAAMPVDAVRRVVAPDARAAVPPRDARALTVAPAAPVETPKGTGTITIPIKDGTFFNLMIDGVSVTAPHMKKPIAAGPHTIVFLDPKDGHVLYQTTIRIGDGDKVTLRLP